jgi:AcrR family transcriptional regulator
MPKRVDHEERRRQITDALVRTAAIRGLQATGMREVAAEAGVSLRLVQYYFGTKEELLLAAARDLAVRYSERVMARINRLKETEGPAKPRDVIAAILIEGLPADDEGRTFTIVYTAYLALSLTDPALAIHPLAKNSDAVTDVVAAQLRAAQAVGDMPAHLDPDLEAAGLFAMSAGFGMSVLTGRSSPGQARAVVDYQLNRLFRCSSAALRQAPMKITRRSPDRLRHRQDLPWPGRSFWPRLPLARIPKRNLLEPDTVVPGGPGNVEVTVNNRRRVVSEMPVPGPFGSAPLCEFRVAQNACRLTDKWKMVHQYCL